MKPKANARGLRHGFPWAYANEIVADRRTRKIPAGALAVLEDDKRNPVALVAVNPESKIMCRVLDRDPAAKLNADWFETRLRRALEMRQRLFPEPYYRLVHAEADGFPGVIVDRFGDTCVVQPNAAWAELHLGQLTDALVSVTGVRTVLKNASGRTRGLEGLDGVNLTLQGDEPDVQPHVHRQKTADGNTVQRLLEVPAQVLAVGVGNANDLRGKLAAQVFYVGAGFLAQCLVDNDQFRLISQLCNIFEESWKIAYANHLEITNFTLYGTFQALSELLSWAKKYDYLSAVVLALSA